ncbi:RNA polymerase sigma-70 factor, ECF subfamily [Dyadobacter sp. SG02]|uniref:RNA polymerase sigma factor SigJ n=1 Tax=Dyadobacter sp. SG02 TaxID=1855291 RepID=UPI0008ADB1CB|nr:RNA polymerase sigma factor SigJ [Dyadobacter sp. SG02]SEJ59951.1 RNA polymerase sigma-70 factor, ECF subfamily [Dyadobacter sp. SG02]
MTTQRPDIFEYRSLLFGIAYRMIGEKSEAEDIVQDVYIRWLEMDSSQVEDPRHYLMRAVTNRSINRLKILQQQRERYMGPWLPEPLTNTDLPEVTPDTGNDLSIGFLFLLEKLNPLERAIFLLRESFDVPYKELETILDIPESACRQHLHRAKEKLQKDKKRFESDVARHQELLQAFMVACVNQDQGELISLLKEDISFYADGGGKASSATKPLFGPDPVSRFILGLFRKAPTPAPLFNVLMVNGLPAIALFDAVTRAPITCICFEHEGDAIVSIYFIRNPDKLKNIRYQG